MECQHVHQLHPGLVILIDDMYNYVWSRLGSYSQEAPSLWEQVSIFFVGLAEGEDQP